MSSEFEKSVRQARGKKMVALAVALILTILGCSELLGFVYPGILHLRAVSAWPVKTGTMTESVLTRYTDPAHSYNPTYNAVDVFRIRDGTVERSCHWNEPVGTQVYDWITDRLKPEHWLWQRGAAVALYVQPGGRLCEPVDGWNRALHLTTLWLRLVVVFSFGGSLALLVWQWSIRVPHQDATPLRLPLEA